MDEAKKEVSAKLHASLKEMKSIVIDELNKIHGQHGFKVSFCHGGVFNEFAYLWCNDKKVAWFKAAVVSGTYDASDDCRDIEYTKPFISCRFYPPNKYVDIWDIQEMRPYNNEGRHYSVNSVEKLPEFLDNIAVELALWMV